MKYVVIGSLNMDYNFRVDSLPRKGETVLAQGSLPSIDDVHRFISKMS